ncbi:MAG: DUF2959 family protein [Planctomycetes bacterium]|nr:DUF2959 family protein [Planctomycetota bacterium]
MKTRITLIAMIALATPTASILPGCTMLGIERSQDLSEHVDETVASMDDYGDSRTELFATLAKLASEPREDLNSRFKSFSRSVDRVVSSEEDLRDSLADMRSTAKTRFLAWSEANQAYEDKDMRLGSQQQRMAAAEKFQDTVLDADRMLVESAAFVAYVKDLRRVLSNDLSDRGVSGVSGYTEKARGLDKELTEMSAPIRARLVSTFDSSAAN